MKFDITIGNPPYNKTTGKMRMGKPIWQKFVQKGLDMTKDGGYLSLVHPMGWRTGKRAFQKVRQELQKYQIEYLEVGDYSKGLRVFKAGTSMDWYTLHKTQPTKPTLIKDQDGVEAYVDVTNLTHIPTRRIPEILSILTGERVDIEGMNKSRYHTQSTGEVQKEKTEILQNAEYRDQASMGNTWGYDELHQREETKEFKYPLAYTAKTCFYTWDPTRGHFGISKVIFPKGAKVPFADPKGEWGMTQFAFAIVDKPENLDKIVQAVQTEEFKQMMEDMAGGSTYEYGIFEALPKDFYKHFI